MSTMASNKVAFLDKAGNPFRIAEAPIPSPGPNEIVVKNHAIALNPLDHIQYTKGIMVKSYPAVLGSDVAGDVYAIGSDVTRFKKGDRVVGHAWGLLTGKPTDGAFALYTNLPAENCASIPEGIPYKNAAVLPLAIDTACSGLFEPDGLNLKWPHENTEPTGKTVIVYGASSSVGSMAVQLATLAGYQVLGIASQKNAEFVKLAGADKFFDYNDNRIVENIVKALDPTSLIGVFDAIGMDDSHDILVDVLKQVGYTGMYVTTKQSPHDLPRVIGSKRMFGIGEFSFPLWRNFVSTELQSGRLKCLPKPEVIGQGLDKIQAGLDQLGKGVSAKKLVVEL